jgi:hypothetical protein
LEEFYNDKHNEILQVQLDLFYEYLNNRK